MIILGIDPGSIATGFGFIEKSGNKHKLVHQGVIRSKPKELIQMRYLNIFNELEKLLEEIRPDAIAIESQFVQKNVQSALKLGMAKGVAMLPGAKRDIPIFEYTPMKAKLAVTGNGRASKEQVTRMVRTLLSISETLAEDAADALALAICHAHQGNHVRIH